MKFAYDSRREGRDDETPLARALAAFVGQRFRVEADSRGRVRAVTGFEAALRDVLEPAGRPAVDPLVAGFRLRPGSRVAPGDAWKGDAKVRIETGGPDRAASLTFVNAFTFRRAESVAGTRCARVEVATEVGAVAPTAPAADGTWHFVGVEDAEVGAATHLDPETGGLVRERVEAHLELAEKHVSSASGAPPPAAVETARPFARFELDLTFVLDRRREE